MKLSAVFVGSLLALGLVNCTVTPGNGPNGSNYTSSPLLTLPQASPAVAPPGCALQPLAIQPASAWTPNGGSMNPVCAPAANPEEQSFVDVASGVELTAASNQEMCCTCTARSRVFKVGTTPVAGTRLMGTFAAGRGVHDTWSVASMRVTLKQGGSEIARRVFAQENRQNDNCVGSSELPETVLPDVFDIDLSSMLSGSQGAATFDEIDVDLQGYACGTASNAIALLDLEVATCAGAPAPSPSSAPSGSPSANPATVGFMPTGCENPANPMPNVDSGSCPNGPDLSQMTTVTCRVSPCQGAGCTAVGTLSVQGNVAVADCSALKPVCDTIAASVPNPQVIIDNRVPCL
jgi:hypothetical protein